MSATKARPGLQEVLDQHRVIVCMGTGGVGKTTVAAAVALAGALAGRRAMVLTIDPARQLARALGLDALARGGERVAPAALSSAGLRPSGSLHAGMLDQKAAWDAFIARHAPRVEVRDALLENPFYQQLSTSFAGSSEYMAIEELCRLDESGDYDLIVIDTPPTGHAIDFLEAPERIDRLLDPRVTDWLRRRYGSVGPAAYRTLSWGVRYVLRRLERATGARTLLEISAFLTAIDALFGDLGARSERARALLRGEGTGFVLVVGPGEGVLAQGDALMETIRAHAVPLRAVVINRVHPLPSGPLEPAAVEDTFAYLSKVGASEDVVSWVRGACQEALATEHAERQRLSVFASALPSAVAWAEVSELDRDAHSLSDLVRVARMLGLEAEGDRDVRGIPPRG